MTLSDQGFEAMRTGNYIDAEKYLEQALMLNPDNAGALFNLGVVFENTGRPEKARHMYERVLELKSKGMPVMGRTAANEEKDLAQIAGENLDRMNQREKAAPPTLKESPSAVSGEPTPPAVSEKERAEGKKAEKECREEPTPVEETPRDIYYSLQVGAYQSEAHARTRAEDLDKMGQDGFVREGTSADKGKLYRVYLNRYKTKEEAIIEAEKLRKSKLISDYVVRPLKSPTRQEVHIKNGDASPKFYLHIGSFMKKANAEKTVDRLKQSGLKASYAERVVQGETWYRVLIGDYPDEEEARRAGAELKKKGIISYFKPIKRK